MKKNIIAYRSLTGHSKKIANYISKELNIDVIQIDKYDNSIIEANNLFIIGGIYASSYHDDIYKFVEKLDFSKIDSVTLMTSSATGKDSPLKIKELLIERKANLNPIEFTCKGRFLLVSVNHPNQKDYESALEFVKKII